jgi:hypothetical protein
MVRNGMGLARRAAAIVMIAGVLAAAGPADAAQVQDRNLARGPLDLKLLEATKHDAGAPLHLRLVTYQGWHASIVDASGRNRFFYFFNSDRTGGADFIGEVFRAPNGHLVMRITNSDGQFLKRVRAYHPNPRTLKVTVPRGLPNPDGNVWLAGLERYWGTTVCTNGCHDRIPNKGWMKLTPGQ